MRKSMWAAMLVVFAGLFVPSSAKAQSYTYTTWTWSPQYSYYYRTCTFSNGAYFYAIYQPSLTRDYIFCYNPYRQRYWCACPTRFNPFFGHINFNVTFISIFITIQTPATSLGGANDQIQGVAPGSTSSVGMSDQNGNNVGTLGSMPTDLPPG